MKKTILAACFVIAGFLTTNAIAEQTVTGQNWVGYVKLPTPPAGDITLLGVNFEGVGSTNGGGVALNELFNTEALIGGGREVARDQVYIWDTVELKYNDYSYNEGDFYNNAGEVENPLVYPGQAIWFRSAPSAELDRDLYSLGQVNLSDTTPIFLAEGLNLLSSPYPAPMDFSAIDWIDQGATAVSRRVSSDQVHVFHEGAYHDYYLRPDGTWEDEHGNPVEIVVEPGVAVWYRAASSYTHSFSRPFKIEDTEE